MLYICVKSSTDCQNRHLISSISQPCKPSKHACYRYPPQNRGINESFAKFRPVYAHPSRVHVFSYFRHTLQSVWWYILTHSKDAWVFFTLQYRRIYQKAPHVGIGVEGNLVFKIIVYLVTLCVQTPLYLTHKNLLVITNMWILIM